MPACWHSKRPAVLDGHDVVSDAFSIISREARPEPVPHRFTAALRPKEDCRDSLPRFLGHSCSVPREVHSRTFAFLARLHSEAGLRHRANPIEGASPIRKATRACGLAGHRGAASMWIEGIRNERAASAIRARYEVRPGRVASAGRVQTAKISSTGIRRPSKSITGMESPAA
jgi:hypothetical protein